MNIFYSTHNIDIQKPVLTVGTFDGLHAGHMLLLNRLKNKAKEIGGQSVVFSFNPHPRQVLSPSSASLKLLNTIDEKILLLEKAGIDNVIIFPFSKEFAKLDSCSFIEDILYKQLKVSHLVVGYDHHFGRDRQGDVEKLKTCAKPFGFDVERVEALQINNQKVSSTVIRNLLTQGSIKNANEYLTYNYFITGKVMHGKQIGRKIGFPTANIFVEDKFKLIPKNGVYAVEIIVDGKLKNGMLNIGTKPTVNENQEIFIEVYIFDFHEDIYSKYLQINFIEYIRSEKKFDSIIDLKFQIEKDSQTIQNLFNSKF